MALRAFQIQAVDTSTNERPVWVPLTDMIATVLTNPAPQATSTDNVYKRLREIPGAQREESWGRHLGSFAAAVQYARRTIADDTNVEHGLEAAELLLGQEPRD